MNVRRIAKWILTCITALLVVAVIGGYTIYRSHVRSGGLEAAQQWARMAPIPDSASGLAVEARGGPFTREFTIRFNAPTSDVNAWLQRSRGTSGLKPVVDGKIRVYTVEPGGGAMHAEVTVDDDFGSVSIHTYWS